jgi:hypothetical protein
MMSHAELVLGVVMAIYLVMGYKTPSSVAGVLDSIFGKIGLLLFVVWMFLHHSPLLGILSLFVAFDLVRRSQSTVLGLPDLQVTTESNRAADMENMNHGLNPYTLEQEIVQKMAPIRHGVSLTAPSYKPTSSTTSSTVRV